MPLVEMQHNAFCCAPQESMDSPIDRRSDYYRQRARQKRPAQPQATSSGPPAQRLLTAPNVLTFLRVLLVRRACLGTAFKGTHSFKRPPTACMRHCLASLCSACC